MSISTDDIVRSAGRVQVIQDGRPRFIEFSMAKVIDVGGGGITVNPVGKKAMITCRPDDLELVKQANHDLEQTPASRESATQQAEHVKGMEALPVQPVTEDEPDGSLGVSGAMAEPEQPKPTLKQLRAKKKAVPASEKSKPTPRRRRR